VQRKLIQRTPLDGLHLPHKVNERSRVLTNDEIRDVWEAADAMGGHFPTILKLLIVTGQRRSEIAALEGGWITANSISLPKEITKNARPHLFPIGPFAVSLLPSRPGRLFPARGSADPFNGWSPGMDTLRKKLAPDFPHFTLHDLRRTLCTKWAEDLRIAPHLIDGCEHKYEILMLLKWLSRNQAKT
jgi:integrase